MNVKKKSQMKFFGYESKRQIMNLVNVLLKSREFWKLGQTSSYYRVANDQGKIQSKKEETTRIFL